MTTRSIKVKLRIAIGFLLDRGHVLISLSTDTTYVVLVSRAHMMSGLVCLTDQDKDLKPEGNL